MARTNKTLSKTLLGLLLSLMFLFSAVLPCAAEGENQLPTEVTFESTEKDATYDGFEEVEGKKLTVRYEVIDEKPEVTEEKVTLEKTMSVLAEGDESFDETITENGLEYKLKDVSYSGGQYDLGTADVEEKKVVELESQLPQTITADFTDEASGKTVKVTLPLNSVKKLEDSVTPNDFSVHFTGVDATVLVYGDFEVPNEPNASVPPVMGHESAYLSALADMYGVDTTHYTITGAEWTSEVYESNNQPSRDAVIHCVDTRTRYEGTYGGVNVNLGTVDGFVATAEYEGVSSKETGKTLYTIKAIATYTKGGLTAVQTVVLAVVGAAVVGFGIVALLLTASKKRKKKSLED